MPMTPQTRALVDVAAAAFPALGTEVLDAAQARRMLAARPPLPINPIPLAAVENRSIPGPRGAPDIPVRIYRPIETNNTLPVVMFCHGGGFVICDLDTHDQFCRLMANESGALVVSVDYRRAPEHRFPAAAHDAYAALVWIAAHAPEFGGDPTRLAVAGDSAGGNLAAVAAIQSRDNHGPAVTFQLLLYPFLDPTRSSDSYRENAQGYFVTEDHLRWYWEQYLGNSDGADPYASPLHADPTGLPPAYIVTAEYDPLRDEGEAYGHRLATAEAPTEIHRYKGMFHGFMTMFEHLPDARDANTAAFAALRKALERA